MTVPPHSGGEHTSVETLLPQEIHLCQVCGWADVENPRGACHPKGKGGGGVAV